MQSSDVQMEREWKDLIKDIVRRHHRFPIFSLLASASKTYLRAYYNENHYIFAHNGERFVLETMDRVMGGRDLVVFDVGAHSGLWTHEVLKSIRRAEVHCFEIAPQMSEILIKTLHGHSNVYANGLGLSAEAGTLMLNYVPGGDQHEHRASSDARRELELRLQGGSGSGDHRRPVPGRA